jgi:hypothetical protein
VLVKPAFAKQALRHRNRAAHKAADFGFVGQHAFIEFHAGEAQGTLPVLQRFEHRRQSGLIPHTGAIAGLIGFRREFHQHIEHHAPRPTRRTQHRDAFRRIHDAQHPLLRIGQQVEDRGDVRIPHHLIRDQDAADAMRDGNLRLLAGRHGDAPCAALDLALEQPGRHRRLAMGRQRQAIGLDKGAHPAQIMSDAALAQHGGGERHIACQQVPRGLPGAANALVEFKMMVAHGTDSS